MWQKFVNHEWYCLSNSNVVAGGLASRQEMRPQWWHRHTELDQHCQWWLRLSRQSLTHGLCHHSYSDELLNFVVWPTMSYFAGLSKRCHVTFNRWRTVESATWKYDDLRLNMSHEGAARVWHVLPRVVIFPCRTNYRVSYVLSSDQLQESWIICKLKLFSPCICMI